MRVGTKLRRDVMSTNVSSHKPQGKRKMICQDTCGHGKCKCSRFAREARKNSYFLQQAAECALVFTTTVWKGIERRNLWKICVRHCVVQLMVYCQKGVEAADMFAWAKEWRSVTPKTSWQARESWEDGRMRRKSEGLWTRGNEHADSPSITLKFR